MQTRTVIVVGGGFAGWSVINHLQQFNPKRTMIILVDNKEYFENTPGLSQYLVHHDPHHHSEPSDLHFSHATHLMDNSQLVCGDVTEVTNDEVVVVRYSKSKGKETARLRYDCLVICSGRRYRPTDFEDHSLLSRIKHINAQRDMIKRAETLLVVGGGPAGVELAAELAHKHRDKSVTIMHRGGTLIARTCDSASAYADTALRAMKVHIVYNKESNLVDKSATSSLPIMVPQIYDQVFACIGGAPNTKFMRDHFANHLDEHGAIMVNRFFQLEGLPHIFAVGDVTALSEEKTSERAMVHGELVAKHIKSFLKRKSMRAQGYIAKSVPFMQVISLGPEDGIALLSGEMVAVGLDIPKMKREYIKTSYATLVSKLVLNKRHSLYGLISKAVPAAPPSPPPLPIKVEEEPHVEIPKNSHRLLCCFTLSNSEPNLMLKLTNVPPPVTPRDELHTPNRRTMRRMSSAVGFMDVADTPDPAPDFLNPKALVLGADNAIAKLLIEALAHTGMRTRAAVQSHTWITQSASYKLSYSMLVHNVECVDYNINEEQSLDELLEGIQIVLLPIGLMDPTQIRSLISKLTTHQALKCVIYVRLIFPEDLTIGCPNEIEELIRSSNLPCVIVRHSITMQSVRDVIGRQVHCFRTIVWPEKATSTYVLDQKDLCTALAMILHESKRHVGKVYHFVGPELLSGADIASILSSMVTEEITFIAASNERITDSLRLQGFNEVEAHTWLQKICAPPLTSRPLDLDLILETRPATFSKWLNNNIHSFSDVWTSISTPGSSQQTRTSSKGRPRSGSLRKSEAPSLQEVLSDKIFSRKFHEFLEAEYCAENYLFWQSVERFREINNIDEMISTAVDMSNQYIHEGGANAINIDQKLRVTILSNMRMGLSRDIFDVAQERVLRLMEMDSYPRFAKAAGLLSKSSTSRMMRARSSGHVEPVHRNSTVM